MSSTCAKCGGHSFKIETKEPAGSRYKFNFVQCTSCESPVGVLDFFNTGAQLEEQKREISSLHGRLSTIEDSLQQVLRLLRQR